MKHLICLTSSAYCKLVAILSTLQPVSLLLFRLWVALAFWRAGIVKLDDPMGTAYLFNYEYHVPILPPDLAATMGTWVELIAPWLLGLGLFGRTSAMFLFFYNIIAVISYPALWPHGLWNGFIGTEFTDHKAWGLMLLAVILYGPGKLSIDTLICRWLSPCFSKEKRKE